MATTSTPAYRYGYAPKAPQGPLLQGARRRHSGSYGDDE